ncbi:hypothetical protein Vafri_3523, partial [Volvox africanus]
TTSVLPGCARQDVPPANASISGTHLRTWEAGSPGPHRISAHTNQKAKPAMPRQNCSLPSRLSSKASHTGRLSILDTRDGPSDCGVGAFRDNWGPRINLQAARLQTIFQATIPHAQSSPARLNQRL